MRTTSPPSSRADCCLKLRPSTESYKCRSCCSLPLLTQPSGQGALARSGAPANCIVPFGRRHPVAGSTEARWLATLGLGPKCRTRSPPAMTDSPRLANRVAASFLKTSGVPKGLPSNPAGHSAAISQQRPSDRFEAIQGRPAPQVSEKLSPRARN